jgi:hypothetical protein
MSVRDIGISVDAAADIAKESADLIVLEKDLMCSRVASSWGGMSSPTSSNNPRWEPAQTSEKCSACWEPVHSCHFCPWTRFIIVLMCPTFEA